MPDPTVYEPTEGERFQIARIQTMFALSMKAQAARRKQWRRNEQMMGGDHFAIFPNLDKERSRVVYNMCFEVRETILPILTDLLPKPEVKPEPTQNRGIDLNKLLVQAQKIEDGIQHQLDNAGMPENWPLAVKSILDYGQCPIRVLPKKDSIFLDIDLVDNFAFFLDGGGATSVRTSQWIMTVVPTYISEIVRTYGPEKSSGIAAEGALDNFRSFNLFPEQSKDRDGRQGANAVTTDTDGAATTLDLDIRKKIGLNRNLGQVLLIDIWSRHKILDTEPVPGETPQPVETYHHLTVAGDRVLVDEPSKYPVGKPPFVMMINYPTAKSPWGMGESEQIETLNVAADVLLSEAVDGAVLGGNPPVTATSDMKAENPTGIPMKPRATIWLKSRASVVKWMETKQISPALVSLPLQISDFINTVSGVHDATAGRKPGGVTAASAIAKLQDAANSRIRYKEKTLRRGPLGELYTRIMEHLEGLGEETTFLARSRADGRPKIASYGPEDFESSGFTVSAGVPITENKVDLINLLTELAPLLGLTGDELIELMPAEIRNLIQAVRNRSRDQGPLAGLDMEKLSPQEQEVLASNDEDAIMRLLASLQERGLYSPPIDEDLKVAQNGAAGVRTAT